YGTVTLHNTVISSNVSTASGGALVNSGSGRIDVLDGSIITNNRANSCTGISNQVQSGDATGGMVTVVASTISNNLGGSICNNRATVSISGSAIKSNYGADYGGAIYNIFAGVVSIDNSLITGNSASYYGGAIYNTGDSSIVTIANSTLSGNS